MKPWIVFNLLLVLYTLISCVLALDDDDNEDDHKSGNGAKMFNFASHTAGAVILDKSPDSAKGFSNLLVDDKDKYGISPCNEKKWVVIGLSEDIMITSVVIANYERYSSMLKDFQLMASNSYPASDWIDLGTYTAEPKLGEQMFNISSTSSAHTRYLKIKFKTHYDNDALCTLSQIKVHGVTVIASFKQEVEWSDTERLNMLQQLSNEITEEEAKEPLNHTEAELIVSVAPESAECVLEPPPDSAEANSDGVAVCRSNEAMVIEENTLTADNKNSTTGYPNGDSMEEPISPDKGETVIESVVEASNGEDSTNSSGPASGLNIVTEFIQSLMGRTALPVADKPDDLVNSMNKTEDADEQDLSVDLNFAAIEATNSNANAVVDDSLAEFRAVGEESDESIAEVEVGRPLETEEVESAHEDPSAEDEMDSSDPTTSVNAIETHSSNASDEAGKVEVHLEADETGETAPEVSTEVQVMVPALNSSLAAPDVSTEPVAKPGVDAPSDVTVVPDSTVDATNSTTIEPSQNDLTVVEAVVDAESADNNDESSNPALSDAAPAVNGTSTSTANEPVVGSSESNSTVARASNNTNASAASTSNVANVAVSMSGSATSAPPAAGAAAAMASTPAPLLNCYETLKLVDFQAKMIAKLQKSNSSMFEVDSAMPKNTAADSSNNNVFRILMQRIKALELNNAIMDMYIIQLTECYRTVTKDIMSSKILLDNMDDAKAHMAVVERLQEAALVRQNSSQELVTTRHALLMQRRSRINSGGELIGEEYFTLVGILGLWLSCLLGAADVSLVSEITEVYVDENRVTLIVGAFLLSFVSVIASVVVCCGMYFYWIARSANSNTGGGASGSSGKSQWSTGRK